MSEDEYDKIVATADVLDEVTALRLGLEYEGEANVYPLLWKWTETPHFLLFPVLVGSEKGVLDYLLFINLELSAWGDCHSFYCETNDRDSSHIILIKSLASLYQYPCCDKFCNFPSKIICQLEAISYIIQ